MIRQLVIASVLLLGLGTAGLMAWNAVNRSTPRPGDTEALRRLQARVVQVLSAREPATIRLADYNDDGFSEICIVDEGRDAYASLSERRPRFGLPASGGPRTGEGEYALGLVAIGRAGFAFLPRYILLASESRCFPVDATLIHVTPGRPAASTLEIGRPPVLRLAPAETSTNE